MALNDFLAGLLGSGVGTTLIGFLARDWLTIRIKAAIDKEALIQRAAFDLKRSACLDALAIVDAAFSQRDWKQGEEPINVAKQPLSISDARRAYNQLAVTCSDPKILELYMLVLGLRTPGEPPPTQTADLIVDLRNTMREELGFGTSLKFDRSKAWIANLDGAT